MKKVTAPWCIESKREGKKITMLTAYDFLMAKILDESGIDILLVGDSLGMVVQGSDDTLSVTLDEMIYHTKIVAKGVKRAMVIGDMPFMSFQVNAKDALINAGRLIKEGRANAVKLEGGREVVPHVQAMVKAGIPVMGHIGLTPQSVNEFGGFKVQAKTEQAVRKLISDARALEDAGAFAVVLEAIPSEAARRVTEQLQIPTIGIGAGPECDGQVLVTYDMLGYTEVNIRFVKRYALLRDIIKGAADAYASEVKSGDFPTSEFAYNIEIAGEEESESHETEAELDEYYEAFDDLF
ncbi:MAG: 3-methyl-2-oxobutanoate hydroxymethyltransferase [Candidatus Heimdallarchaeota archaeon]|nr:3-methyl-2-oxobutanoate hydroxymethyltransferase [Candidatus Heimdallarchaeota archaeon]